MSWLSWTWKAAPWLVALAGVLGGGAFGALERMNYLAEKAARADDLGRAQQAVLDAQARDAAATHALEDRYATEITLLKEQANVRDIAIATAPSTAGCAASPAMRALFDGLRARGAAAGAGQPGTAAGTGPGLSR